MPRVFSMHRDNGPGRRRREKKTSRRVTGGDQQIPPTTTQQPQSRSQGEEAINSPQRVINSDGTQTDTGMTSDSLSSSRGVDPNAVKLPRPDVASPRDVSNPTSGVPTSSNGPDASGALAPRSQGTEVASVVAGLVWSTATSASLGGP